MAKLYGIKNDATLNLSLHCETIAITKKFRYAAWAKMWVAPWES